MRCIVIGAGNAGRPVARILNHVGNNVVITDRKPLSSFQEDIQEILLKMEKEGVELRLGSDVPDDLKNFDLAYVSPTIPVDDAIKGEKIKLLKNEDIAKIIDKEIDIDIIGIAGTLGKTSTTHIISHIFESAGYKVWTCSSQHGNLLSEIIVDGIIHNYHKKNDIAVLEIPHGTIRLMSQVKLKVGILTNIYPEHLAEFGGSMDKYTARELLIVNMPNIFIANIKCRNLIHRNDVIWYGSKGNECNVKGELIDKKLMIKYDVGNRAGKFQTPLKMSGYYVENSIAAAAASICYGLDEESIKDALGKFRGIPGHMEYLGKYSNREVYFDAAYIPEGLLPTLKSFSGHSLVVLIDNPDSSTPRDKYGLGNILGRYAKVIIATGYNETIGKLDMAAAKEVLSGAHDSKALKIAVEDMETAGELSIKYSQPGDTILHVGPGAISAYESVKSSMLSGIKKGCNKYG